MRRICSLATLPLVLAFAAAPVPSGKVPPAIAAPELLTPFPSPSPGSFCDGHCHECEEGGFSGHTFDLFSPDYYGNGPHLCEVIFAGCGSAIHPACQLPDAANTDEVTPVVDRLGRTAEGDVDAMVALLRSDPGRFHVNERRSVLQVAGSCSPGHIVAQVPLNAEQLLAAAELE